MKSILKIILIILTTFCLVDLMAQNVPVVVDNNGNIIQPVGGINGVGFTNKSSPIWISAAANSPAGSYPLNETDATIGAGFFIQYSEDLSNWVNVPINGRWQFTNDLTIRDPGFFYNAVEGAWYVPGTYQALSLSTPNLGISMARSTNLTDWVPWGITNGASSGFIPLTTSNAVIWAPDITTNSSGNIVLYYSIGYGTGTAQTINRHTEYRVSNDGTLTNWGANHILATNENNFATCGINDPFILHYNGTVYLFVSEQICNFWVSVYTNSEANFPGPMHLAAANLTPYGIEGLCVLNVNQFNTNLAPAWRLFGSTCNDFPNPRGYAYGEFIYSSTDVASLTSGWTGFNYATSGPRQTFPQYTIMGYTGDQARYIRSLIRYAQGQSFTNIIQPNGSINAGTAASAVPDINFKGMNGNTNSTFGFWDINSTFGANSLDTGVGGLGGVSLWDSPSGNNFGEYFSVAGRIYHGMHSGTHPDWYSYTDGGTPFFHLGVGGNGLIGIGTGNNSLSYPLEIDVLGSGGTGYNQILIKTTAASGFGANIQFDSTSMSGGRKWTIFSGGSSDSPTGAFGFYDNTAGAEQLSILGNNTGTKITGVTTSTGGFASQASNLSAPVAVSPFPATTVKWTNTTSVNIEVYIDNTGVTGTSIKKNNTQIFSSLTGDCTFGLQPGEYFSETYTIGTPSATYSPF